MSIFAVKLEVCHTSSLLIEHSKQNVNQIPSFFQEPSAQIRFSNNTGAHIICLAHGNPPPILTWHTKDGMAINSVPGIR